MKTRASKPVPIRRVIGGVAAILVSGIAIGSLTGAAPRMYGAAAATGPVEVTLPRRAAPPPNAAARCAECGVVTSTREIDAPAAVGEHPLRSHEITIRMKDGTMLVIMDSNPAAWRRGERVKIMAGVN